MTCFVDSTALVKLYADEEGARSIRLLGPLVVADIARAEVPAALWKKQRLGELDPGEAEILIADFEADWFGTDVEEPRFAVVSTTALVMDDAARLTGVHGLLADDAIQLACARAARTAEPTCTSLAAFTESLRDAAAAEGFDLVP